MNFWINVIPFLSPEKKEAVSVFDCGTKTGNSLLGMATS
jgi:hypothetical protein